MELLLAAKPLWEYLVSCGICLLVVFLVYSMYQDIKQLPNNNGKY
jgi:hypothetical protein